MKCILTALVCLSAAFLFAQTSDQYIIAAQGGFSEGKAITMSWTIGDLVTEQSVLRDAVVTQGFQQPTIFVKEIKIDPNTIGNVGSETKAYDFTASVYPNPVSSNINVKVENAEREYFIDVLDQTGRLLSRNKSHNNQEVINLSSLPAAHYELRISLVDSPQSKVFQIIKSH
ncbi:MAG TPA: T9SS type A sorting domain-containing protein [Saprospiraceae bacterium]|nr:T9SS type A sorting domain-containing protein [Saprospiraceae bacterium]